MLIDFVGAGVLPPPVPRPGGCRFRRLGRGVVHVVVRFEILTGARNYHQRGGVMLTLSYLTDAP